MKAFFTSMAGALVALILFTGGALLLAMGIVGVLIKLGEPAPMVVEKGSYLVFDLATNIVDAPPVLDRAQIPAFLAGGLAPSLQLRTITRALAAAAQDDRIQGLYLTGTLLPDGYGSGYAALREVRAALEAFKASGKPVTAYLSGATVREYYLASAASDVVMDPYGAMLLAGLASESVFLTGALEKFGVGIQVTRVGKYKSFIEPFTRREMSPENRAQSQKLLDDIWSDLLTTLARTRGLSASDLQARVSREGIFSAAAAREAGLIDRVAYLDEVLTELSEVTGQRQAAVPFRQVYLDDYARTLPDGAAAPSAPVAIVYAEGAIVDGEGETGEVGGERFARELRQLRLDNSVKAVVLRVNSPGGSATAAEQIQRELRLLSRSKPVVVSMGSYAASGGYWIAAYGQRIFAEPTTVTGSIGVFGLFLNIERLAADVGVTFDRVKTADLADVLTISRPKTEAELAVFQQWVDWIYGQFLHKVVEGRGLSPEVVAEIAQGRVWSGAAALELGLVDELGGLETALAYARAQAELNPDAAVREFPQTRDFADAVVELFSGWRPPVARTGWIDRLTTQWRRELKTLGEFNDPRGLYARLPLELRLP